VDAARHERVPQTGRATSTWRPPPGAAANAARETLRIGDTVEQMLRHAGRHPH
jgi:hypothetical protein